MPGQGSSQVVELARDSAMNANGNCLVIGLLPAFQTLDESPQDPLLAGPVALGKSKVRVRPNAVTDVFSGDTVAIL
jgi:hypothetical protein